MSDASENEAFTGLRLYKDTDGKLAVMLFRDGMITDLEPNQQDKTRALGFYDLDMNPVPDPTEGNAAPPSPEGA